MMQRKSYVYVVSAEKPWYGTAVIVRIFSNYQNAVRFAEAHSANATNLSMHVEKWAVSRTNKSDEEA